MLDLNENNVLRLLTYDIPRWLNDSPSFNSALFEAFARADGTNKEKLTKGFPEHAEAYSRYMQC